MSRPLCSVDGCDSPIVARELCDLHYRRQRRHGDVGETPRLHALCAVGSCLRRALGTRGMCMTHVMRLKRRGTPDDPSGPSACSVLDCTEPHWAKGFCRRHYLRWKKTSDPLTPPNTTPNWRGDAVGYHGAHTRLRELRGSASCHTCACGVQAVHWAYDHLDPNEKQSADGFPFSLDAMHYKPLCARCHRRFDAEAQLTPAQT